MQVSVWDFVTRNISISAISGYQKYLSPHKGFACAHRVLYGGESCSQYIKRIIAEKGLKAALLQSRYRFQRCKEANLILRSQSEELGEELEPPIETEENQQPRKPQPTTPRSSCQDSFDVVDLGINCTDAACNCPELLNLTPDCGALDCGALDCGGCSW
jgi:putative component of membrane protein insertase Oxa1/YidC/SpoIIIJ protein YidD